MPLTQVTAYYGLVGSGTPTGMGVSGEITVGNPSNSTPLPSTSGATFKVELDVDFKVEIPLNTLIPVITGGTGQPQSIQLVISAPGGITSNGNLSVTVAGAHVIAGTYLVPVTTALTTEEAIAAHIAADLGLQAAMNDYGATAGGTDTITFEDTFSRANDATLSVSVAAGLGVSDATSDVSLNGADPAKCYRLAGVTYAADDFEGAALAAPTVIHGIEITPTGATGLLVSTGDLVDSLAGGEVFHKHAVGGLNSIVPANTLTLEALGWPVTALVVLQFSTD